MDKIISIWDIKDGKLTVHKRDVFNDAIKGCPDGRYINTTEKLYPKYTDKQRNTIFGLAYAILKQGFKDLGWEDVSDDFVAEWAKENCLPEDYKTFLKKEHEKLCLNKLTGKKIEIPFRLTITRLNTGWGKEYFANMQRKGADLLGVEIPDPDPNFKNSQNS
jgi:hypothetical protein